MYPTNAYYGNAIVLAAYAGLDEPLFPPTVPGYVQPWIGAEIPTSDALVGVPAFVWGPSARINRHRAGLRDHTPLGAPWLYLLDLEKRDQIPQPPLAEHLRTPLPEPGRLLYFPHHGLGGDLVAQERALALRPEVERGGVTVALTHEQAASPGTVRPYEEVGARVVDLGSAIEEVGSREPFYLERLLLLMRAHRGVRTDALSVFALYAHAAGLPVDGVAEPVLSRHVRADLGTGAVVPPAELRALFDWSSYV